MEMWLAFSLVVTDGIRANLVMSFGTDAMHQNMEPDKDFKILSGGDTTNFVYWIV